jgi:uncharacterized protein (DUF4213/DUF364 family)
MTSTLDTILLPTLERIRSLYASTAGAHAGRMRALVVKPGWNVVLGTEGQHGAAMNFCGYEGSTLDADEVRTWVGMPLLDVAQLGLRRASWHERSIGIASLSALSQPFLTPDALTARGIAVVDRDFSQHLEKEDRVALVGFGGVVSRLRGRCRELHVTDLRPRDAFQSMVIAETITYSPDWVHVHGPEDNPQVLGGADAVAITGSALVNGTMADLLEWSHRARLVSVYGASAAFIPDVLFERGVHLIQAHRVSDPRAFEEGMLEEMNLEPTIQRTQTFQTLRRNAS